MKVKCIIQSRWIPGAELYRSTLRVMLPCTSGEVIDPLLESERSLLGSELLPHWGAYVNGFQWREEVVGNYPTSTEAVKAAQKRAEEIVRLIREIVVRNREAFANEQQIEEEVEL